MGRRGRGRQVGEHEEKQRSLENGPGYTHCELVQNLMRALQGTSNTSAPGPDGISYRFIKVLSKTAFGVELLGQLARELQMGRAPVDWQLSKVVMIPKPGKNHIQLKGWRPINLINCVCKLGEKVVADELQDEGLFHRHQYGSVKGRSALEPVFREVVRAQRALATKGTVAWGMWDVRGGFQNATQEAVIQRYQLS